MLIFTALILGLLLGAGLVHAWYMVISDRPSFEDGQHFDLIGRRVGEKADDL
jgi:hypothetical protein